MLISLLQTLIYNREQNGSNANFPTLSDCADAIDSDAREVQLYDSRGAAYLLHRNMLFAISKRRPYDDNALEKRLLTSSDSSIDLPDQRFMLNSWRFGLGVISLEMSGRYGAALIFAAASTLAWAPVANA